MGAKGHGTSPSGDTQNRIANNKPTHSKAQHSTAQLSVGCVSRIVPSVSSRRYFYSFRWLKASIRSGTDRSLARSPWGKRNKRSTRGGNKARPIRLSFHPQNGEKRARVKYSPSLSLTHNTFLSLLWFNFNKFIVSIFTPGYAMWLSAHVITHTTPGGIDSHTDESKLLTNPGFDASITTTGGREPLTLSLIVCTNFSNSVHYQFH